MRSDDFLNADDVAHYLHLGKNTVYQLAKSGKLASYRVGRKLKFTLEDVEAYVASTHYATENRVVYQQGEGPATIESPKQAISEAASFGALEGDPFIIAGGDVAADLLASAMNAIGTSAQRLVRGSYTALVNLYAGDADAAVVHLYDQRSNSYNIPYARSLAPGLSVVIMRLYGRDQGLIVAKGNPKRLTTWGSLLRDGVKCSNREKGSGARVLFDEKLRAMEARSESIEGYDSHASIASVAIRRVANGVADYAIGTQREALGIEGVEFVPLQKEWVDLVISKRPAARQVIKLLSTLLQSERFRYDASALGPCDLTHMGSIVYES